VTGKAACSFDILSLKNARKVDASESDDCVGSEGLNDRERRVLSVFQSLRGFDDYVVIRVL